jgi:hypothetical protein
LELFHGSVHRHSKYFWLSLDRTILSADDPAMVYQTSVCHPAMDLGSFTVTQQMLPGQILFSIPMQHQVSALDALRDRRVQHLFPARHRCGHSLDASSFLSAHLSMASSIDPHLSHLLSSVQPMLAGIQATHPILWSEEEWRLISHANILRLRIIYISFETCITPNI